MTILVIVESPGKIKKIGSILGANYKVMASFGHVRDVPEARGDDIGLSPPDYKLKYAPTERGRKVLHDLKAEVSRSSSVLLATDPDREGEAIAWHLADALDLKDPQRVTFTAITEEEVKAAIAAPRPLDMDLVHAEETRRALDLMFGYRVTPALSRCAGQLLTAGRVQSPAVRLVVDRERAIADFKVTNHFGAELSFSTADGKHWKAQWDVKSHLQRDERYFLDQPFARKVADLRSVRVEEYSKDEKTCGPEAPFTTSTMQQVAGLRLKMKPKRTMELAQQLYEAGLITYHRTDAPNLDSAGIADIAAYANQAGLPLPGRQRVFKAKEGAQEGHEAIRPTHADQLEAGDTPEEQALYRLIWQRAVASQLADARYAVRTATLVSKIDSVPVRLIATGRTLKAAGFLVIYTDAVEDKEEEDDADTTSSNPVPPLEVKSNCKVEAGRLLSKKTKPPARFTQPTLISELECHGIGRPSTYAAILENTLSRGYVSEDSKAYLLPTGLGETVRDALVGRFTFIDYDYTVSLEEQLDDIAEGKRSYHAVISASWTALDQQLDQLADLKIAPTHPCPTCSKALRRIKGSNGFFWGCSDRDCKTTLPDVKGKPGECKPPRPLSGFSCTACGKPLTRMRGMSKPKQRGQQPRPYDFYSCTEFPICKATFTTGSNEKPAFPAS
jgi:DNA topoisomerase-1